MKEYINKYRIISIKICQKKTNKKRKYKKKFTSKYV